MTTWKKEEFDNFETTDVLEKSKELGLTQEQLIEMYRTMVKIRLFEEMADRQYALARFMAPCICQPDKKQSRSAQDLELAKVTICSIIIAGTDILLPAARM